jgi:Cu/Zn superoxide dismutase
MPGEWVGGETNDKAGGCFADVMLHSSRSEHNEHTLRTTGDLSRLQVTHTGSAYGALMVSFPGVVNLYYGQSVVVKHDGLVDVREAEAGRSVVRIN